MRKTGFFNLTKLPLVIGLMPTASLAYLCIQGVRALHEWGELVGPDYNAALRTTKLVYFPVSLACDWIAHVVVKLRPVLIATSLFVTVDVLYAVLLALLGTAQWYLVGRCILRLAIMGSTKEGLR